MHLYWQENSVIRNIIEGKQVIGINTETNNPEVGKLERSLLNMAAAVLFGYAFFAHYAVTEHSGGPIALAKDHKPQDPFKKGPTIIWRSRPTHETTTLFLSGK